MKGTLNRRRYDKPGPPRRGAITVTSLVMLLVVLGLIGATGYQGYQFITSDVQLSATDKAILQEVVRRDFELAITERGEVESAGDIEVRSKVRTNNQPGLAILRIVPEGERVKEGDFLVELDSSALREEELLQQIAVNTAEALLVEARNLYETAVIAKEEYAEGVYVQERQTLESELFVAEENLSRAQEYLKYSKKLAAKGYVNNLQLKADAFAVDKSRKEVDAAKTKIKVLDDFTRAKMLKQLESDTMTTKARWKAEENSMTLEREKLADIQEQIANCVINAPRDGIVKYAHVRDSRGNDDFVVEEGAVIRERQVIIRMPDSAQMRVEMSINESLVQHVRPGMEAVIRPIGVDGASLRGTVDYINTYAEPSGWRKANVKEYKAYVKIDDDAGDLRSGMTASVTIRSLFEPDVLQVPVQSVYAHGPQRYCFIEQGESIVAQPVECGATNDSFFVIQSGVDESNRVAINPRALVENVNLPELPAERAQQTVKVGTAAVEQTAEVANKGATKSDTSEPASTKQAVATTATAKSSDSAAGEAGG